MSNIDLYMFMFWGFFVFAFFISIQVNGLMIRDEVNKTLHKDERFTNFDLVKNWKLAEFIDRYKTLFPQGKLLRYRMMIQCSLLIPLSLYLAFIAWWLLHDR